MKKLIITLCLAAITVAGTAKTESITYTKADSAKVIKLLKEACRQPAGTNLILFFARSFIGIPYVAHTLEINQTEKLVVNLRQLDCTTLIENVTALYLCMKEKTYSFNSFCDKLRLLRYRNGIIYNYASRLHYFTDWILDNTQMGICHEVQSPTPPFTAIQKINVYFMSKYPEKYKMLKGHQLFIKEIASRENKINGKTFKYIPESEVKNTFLLRKSILDGDIIATTTTLKGLDIQHLGFAVWKKDGLHMLNASSLHHKVVEEPMLLRTYLKNQKSMTGIRIVRLY